MNPFTTSFPQTQENIPTMTRYEDYPRIWTPPVMPSLFVVKVPLSIESLDELTYKTLMQQRVNWMIQRWMSEVPSSQLNTQRLLTIKLSDFHSYQEYPIIDQDEMETEEEALARWQQAWAEVLILDNDTFSQAIGLLGVGFPAAVMTESHPEFQDFLELHQAVYLEEWLNDLIAYA
jgi:hypothetical protein